MTLCTDSTAASPRSCCSANTLEACSAGCRPTSESLQQKLKLASGLQSRPSSASSVVACLWRLRVHIRRSYGGAAAAACFSPARAGGHRDRDYSEALMARVTLQIYSSRLSNKISSLAFHPGPTATAATKFSSRSAESEASTLRESQLRLHGGRPLYHND